jgi:hypothetical protein
MKLGEKVKVSASIEVYKGVEKVYLYESVTEESIVVVTRRDGGKSFSVQTNDHPNDEFNENILSKVLIEPGCMIVKGQMVKGNLYFTVYCVGETLEYDSEGLMTEVVDSFRSNQRPNKLQLRKVVEHCINGIKAKRNGISDYENTKYSINPSRNVVVALFRLDEEGKYSAMVNGKRHVLKDGSVDGEGIYRIYFPRNLASKSIIFCNGVKVKTIDITEIQEYIDRSNITHETDMQLVELKWDEEYVGMITHNQIIRVIYKSATGYSSCAISDNDLDNLVHHEILEGVGY